ncbi:hypothetical protein [Streptomyces canus]
MTWLSAPDSEMVAGVDDREPAEEARRIACDCAQLRGARLRAIQA